MCCGQAEGLSLARNWEPPRNTAPGLGRMALLSSQPKPVKGCDEWLLNKRKGERKEVEREGKGNEGKGRGRGGEGYMGTYDLS